LALRNRLKELENEPVDPSANNISAGIERSPV